MGNVKRSLAFSIIFLMTATLLFVWYSTPSNSNRQRPHIINRHSSSVPQQLQCYLNPGNVIPELDDSEPVPGESIFFHETSCPTYPGDFPLNARQACAIESAALSHPEKNVFVLFLSPVTVMANRTKNKAMQALSSYFNILPRHIYFTEYIKSSPLRHLFAPLQQSGWPVSHASDILRYTTLYRFAGTYLDMDIMVLKPLPQSNNYVGAESPWSLGAGAISFGADTVGREMAAACADEIARHYNPKDWGANGPGVITRVLQRRCKMVRTIQMWGKSCAGFSIYTPSAFYAVAFEKYRDFFTPGKTELVRKLTNNSLLIHYWNKKTSGLKVTELTPFYNYAKENCPRVFEAVDGVF